MVLNVNEIPPDLIDEAPHSIDEPSRADELLEDWKRNGISSGQFRIGRMFFWTTLVAVVFAIPQITGGSVVGYLESLTIYLLLFAPMVTLLANGFWPALSKPGRVNLSTVCMVSSTTPSIIRHSAYIEPGLVVAVGVLWTLQILCIVFVWHHVFSKKQMWEWRRQAQREETLR